MRWILLALFGLVCVEWLLRLYWSRFATYLVYPPDSRRRVFTDPVISNALAPQVINHYNRLGERGPAPDPDDDFQVLVAGGSTADCYFLDQSTTWPEVLRRELDARGARGGAPLRRAYVGTVARSSLRTRDVAVLLDGLATSGRRADLVILCCGMSDLLRWITAAFDDDSLRKETATEEMFFWHRRDGFSVWRRDAALVYSIKKVRAKLRRQIDHRQAGKFIGKLRAKRAGMRDSMEPPPLNRVLESVDEGMRMAIAAAKRVAPEVVVVTQPCAISPANAGDERFWAGGVGADPMTGLATHFVAPLRLRSCVDQVNEAIRRTARACSVPVITVSEEVLAADSHMYDDFHLTAAGAEHFGATVAAALPDHAYRTEANRSDPLSRE